MSGFIDLHCHYVPAVDDGVRTMADGLRLCRELAAIGYERVVATPHIRTAMFENRKPNLEASWQQVRDEAAQLDGMPQLGLGAEHFFDDVFWELFSHGESLPYPGGHAALVEFPQEGFPRGLEERLFRMNVKGVRPVIAHPERYPVLFRSTEPLDPLLEVGAVAQLDLMSLRGRYGRRPRRTAERMLDEGVYGLACSDCHRPDDVEEVARAIETLRERVGDDEASELLAEGPRALLEGTWDR